MKKFAEITGTRHFISRVSSENIASQKLMRKLGGIPAGVVPIPGISERIRKMLEEDDDPLPEWIPDLAVEFNAPPRTLRSHVLVFNLRVSRMKSTYELIHSKRKTIALQIKGDGHIIVRAPLRMAARDIQRFVDSKAAWIKKHLAIIQQRQQPVAPAFTLEQLHQLADAAKQDIPRRVARFAALVGVTYGRITIRAQKSR